MNNAQLNTQNPAIRRILSEIKKLRSEPSDDFDAHPVDDNLFDWHFVLRGPEDTPFAGGMYHGRIILPAQYPYKPPEFMFLCPTGRFEVGKKICLSISQHHPELWQPGWDIRTALTAIQSFMPTAGNGAIAALDYSDEERRRLADRSRDASTASLRAHGMLENFEEFLQKPRPAPGDSPAARGAAAASSGAAAAASSPSSNSISAAAGVETIATPLRADVAPSFGTPSPSPAQSGSAEWAPSLSTPSPNPSASAPSHQQSVLAGAARMEAAASVGADNGVGSGAATGFSPEGLRQRKSLPPHSAGSPVPARSVGALQAASAPGSASGADAGSASVLAGVSAASVAAAAARGGYVRQNTPSEITTAPPTPAETPPATNMTNTPATPNSGTLAGARFGAQQRGVGGANAAGRQLHMTQAAGAARGDDTRNVPPPTEDEQLLASISRLLAFLLFCLVARRGIVWAFPEVDWQQVGVAVWQDLVSLSETAHALYSDAQPAAGSDVADMGSPQPEL